MKRIISLLGLARKSGNLIAGFSNCLYHIERRKVKLVLITTDAGRSSRRKITGACHEQGIPYLVQGTKEEMAAVAGRPVCIIGIISGDLAQGIMRTASEQTDGFDSG